MVRSDEDEDEFRLSWFSITRADAIATFFEMEIKRKIESLVTSFAPAGARSVSLNFSVPLLNV